MSHNNNLNILYWNANSIANKILEFYSFLTQHNVDIACICETFLKPDQNIASHPDYVIYRLDRDLQQRGGGVLLAVKKSIKHSILPSLNTKILECLGVSVLSKNKSKIDIFSVYLPGGASTSDINSHFANDLSKIVNNRNSFFAPGDYNSKHRHWNCSRANTAGKILYNELCKSRFLILHPPDPTHIPADSKKIPSTIDIVLTNGLHSTSQLDNLQLNSDHNPVFFQIKLSESLVKNDTLYHRSFKNADWDKYREIITYSLNVDNIELDDITSQVQIDSMIQNFTDTIFKAQSKAVPLIRKESSFLELTPDIVELQIIAKDQKHFYKTLAEN